MSKTLLNTPFAQAFLACFPKPGEVIKTEGRGAPVKKGIEVLARNVNMGLNARARKVAELQPFDTLRIINSFLPEFTPEQRERLAQTKDAQFGGIDPETGSILHHESRAGFDCKDPDDVEGRYENVILSTAQGLAAYTGEVHFVRLVRWAEARCFRVGNGEDLEGRAARNQYKIYVSSCPEKNESAFLFLATVHPDGRIERLATVADAFATLDAQEAVTAPSEAVEALPVAPATEVSSETETPVAPQETKAQRDARRKREKRLAAKEAVTL